MPAEPLPASVQTLYAELLDLAIQAEAGRIAEGLPAGTFVAKEIRGARYWYLQVALGTQKTQRYLGRETPELIRWMGGVTGAREVGQLDSALRERLVAMLIQGGARREEAPSGRVLRLLADLGVFHRGGVLVGTHAFQAYGNLLGLRFEQRHQRTEDIHSAHDLAIAFGLLDEPRAE
ncbi:MAG TPA: GSU2403 family nucleotidyltransferase fold protein, partial [Thermoanaerobaculia bacterium]|nr:GSU2403 family nucleotidyltransferase fold protein [Thermoanaerobaculia bacterium]